MADAKRASIDVEAIAARQINEVSASDFLAVLNARGLGSAGFRIIPEKKKVELWAEPEHYTGVKVGDFIDKIGEKKKVEMEKPPISEYSHKAVGSEVMVDPRLLEDIVSRVANEVVRRLGR